MRTLYVLQHVPYEHPGTILDWARERTLSVQVIKLYDGKSCPVVSTSDLLLVMGGPMGVFDDDDYPWMRDEKQVIKDATRYNVPTLGICLGAQLIAHVLGADVRRNLYQEIGFFPITLTLAAVNDALFHQVPKIFTPFHWHGDTFMIPAGAVRIAGNDACMNQGFIGPGNVMGLQFHLEADKRLIGEWTNRLPQTAEPPHVQNIDQILTAACRQSAQNTLILHTLLDRFFPTTL
jgi:GMP synthase-like glutamine amidotransferase